jgi:uroporphyrinogen decarboxylase
MNGKERVFAALSHKQVDVVPWVPFAGVHAGKLKGFNAQEVLSDGEKLLASLLEVNRIYDPDGQPVMFDLQVEAEILGCKLLWAEKAPPSVATHPLQTRMDIPGKIPEERDGRLPIILQTMRIMNERVGDKTALYGLVTGPFTLASHLRGTEIFMDMFDHPDYLAELLAYCTDVGRRMSDLLIDAGMHVIAVVDPLVSQISSKHFQEFLTPLFYDLFAYIREKDVFSSFFVCGDATKNIEVMCQTKPDCIAIDENIDLVKVKQITDQHNITLEGNIPLTSHMLLGNQQDNMKYVLDLFGEISTNGIIPTNLIISPGCDMPYDIPIENVIGTMQAIREPETARVMLANYHSQEYDMGKIDIPDYVHLDKTLIEVFTLDSSTCPACGYMKLAAERAAEEMSDQVEMVEYKITTPENIARMKKMHVQNLPSILIDGKLKFSSLIPSNRELLKAIKESRK